MCLSLGMTRNALYMYNRKNNSYNISNQNSTDSLTCIYNTITKSTTYNNKRTKYHYF